MSPRAVLSLRIRVVFCQFVVWFPCDLYLFAVLSGWVRLAQGRRTSGVDCL